MRRWLNADFKQVREHSLAIAVGVACFALATIQIWKLSNFEWNMFGKFLGCAALGISVSIAARLSFEKNRDYLIGVIAGFAGLILFYFAQKDSIYFFTRFVQLAVLTHLWVAIAPAIRTRFQNEKVTGRTNWFLITRVAVVAVQSTILGSGLALALASLEFLFGIEVSSRAFETLYAFIFFIVTVFLLVAALGERESESNPEILRRLIKDVFAPLIVLYTVILYCYTAQIIVTAEWPKGIVGLLVTGLAAMVTFAFLIRRPFEAEGKLPNWVEKLSQFGFALLLPPLLLLAGAVWRRVSEYGWTEDRIILAVLTLWMIGISLYYLKPKNRTIHAIPVSLLVVTSLFWIGPTSISRLARYSQLKELKALKNQPESVEKNKRALDTFRYLCRNHAFQGLAETFGLSDKDSEPLTEKASRQGCWDSEADSLIIKTAAKAGFNLRDGAAANANGEYKLSLNEDGSGTYKVSNIYFKNVMETPVSDASGSLALEKEALSFAITRDKNRPILKWRFSDQVINSIDLLDVFTPNGIEEKKRPLTYTQRTDQGELQLIFYRAMTIEYPDRTEVQTLQFYAYFTPRK